MVATLGEAVYSDDDLQVHVFRDENCYKVTSYDYEVEYGTLPITTSKDQIVLAMSWFAIGWSGGMNAGRASAKVELRRKWSEFLRLINE